MSKILLLLGIVFCCLGLFWPWLKQLPLGRLPGDIVIVRENFRFYFPLSSCILVSLVLSILLWLFRR